MTDSLVTDSVSNQSIDASTDNQAAQSVSDMSAQTSTQAAQTAQEKMLRQSEVNEITGHVRKEAYEKGKRDAANEYQKTVSAPSVNANVTQSIGGVNQLPDEQIRRLINEEAQKMSQMAVAQKIAQDFTQKLVTAKDKYEDFEQQVSELDLASMPHIVDWANSLDNTADVIYHLAKYPEKLASVTYLAKENPRKAAKLLHSLSDSIKQNETAKNQPSVAEPLSQVRPSTTGTDNGSMSVSDYRKQSWLRG